eukprot:2109388-Rhodomonas_salina.1
MLATRGAHPPSRSRVPGEPDAGCEWALGGAADDAGGGACVGPGPVEQGERDLDALGQGLRRERLRGGAHGGSCAHEPHHPEDDKGALLRDVRGLGCEWQGLGPYGLSCGRTLDGGAGWSQVLKWEFDSSQLLWCLTTGQSFSNYDVRRLDNLSAIMTFNNWTIFHQESDFSGCKTR